VKSIRILLVVTEGSPELHAALTTIPPRLRAERIRALATTGLAALTGDDSSNEDTAQKLSLQNPQPSSTGDDSALVKVQALAKRLGGGL
jgi:hypothetical protein